MDDEGNKTRLQALKEAIEKIESSHGVVPPIDEISIEKRDVIELLAQIPIEEIYYFWLHQLKDWDKFISENRFLNNLVKDRENMTQKDYKNEGAKYLLRKYGDYEIRGIINGTFSKLPDDCQNKLLNLFGENHKTEYCNMMKKVLSFKYKEVVYDVDSDTPNWLKCKHEIKDVLSNPEQLSNRDF